MQRIPIALKEAAPDALKREVLAIPENVAEDWRAAIEVEEDAQLAQVPLHSFCHILSFGS